MLTFVCTLSCFILSRSATCLASRSIFEAHEYVPDILHIENTESTYSDNPKDFFPTMFFIGNKETARYNLPENTLKKEILCDVERLLPLWYRPSVCTDPSRCIIRRGSEIFTNSSCLSDQMCCPADKVTDFQHIHFLPIQEIPYTLKFHPNMGMIGYYMNKAPRSENDLKRRTWSPQHFNLTLVQQFPVCGMKKWGQKNDYFNLYFCVREDNCNVDDPFTEDSDVEYFNNDFNRNFNNKQQRGADAMCALVPLDNLFRGQSTKIICCNSLHVRVLRYEFFSYVKRDVDPFFEVQQVPFYLKYAPGFRASYMCEHYARSLCGTNINVSSCFDKCPSMEGYEPDDYTRWARETYELGDIPHQALVGAHFRKYYLYFHCGGSLISLRWVLSSKRCQFSNGIRANVVLLGVHDLENSRQQNSEEMLYVIDDTLEYPFDKRTLPYDQARPSNLFDYALYKLNRDVRITPFIRPACIYHSSHPRYNKMFFTGFGTSIEEAGFARHNTLKVIEMKDVFTHDFQAYSFSTLCSPANTIGYDEDFFYSRYGVRELHMMCARTTWKNDSNFDQVAYYGAPCEFDEGGPLQYKLLFRHCMYRVFAVLSSTRKHCLPGDTESVYQTLNQVLYEIEEVVWKYPLLEDVPLPIVQVDDPEPDFYYYNRLKPLPTV